MLGPIPWNIPNDGAVRAHLGEETRTISFADDLAVLVKGEDQRQLEQRAKLALLCATR